MSASEASVCSVPLPQRGAATWWQWGGEDPRMENLRCDHKTISKGRVTGDQKIPMWQDHAPDPTAWITTPQKSYTSLGRGDSASGVLCFPGTGWLKSPATSSSGPESGKVLWCHYGAAAGGWDACTNTCRHKHNRWVWCTHKHTCACVCSSPSYSAHFDLLHQNKTPLCRIYVKATTSSSPARALAQKKGPCPFPLFTSEFLLYPKINRRSHTQQNGNPDDTVGPAFIPWVLLKEKMLLLDTRKGWPELARNKGNHSGNRKTTHVIKTVYEKSVSG